MKRITAIVATSILFACLLLPCMAVTVCALVGNQNNGDIQMDRAALTEKKQLELFGDRPSPLSSTDPDFAAIRDRLMYGEIEWHGSLNEKMRRLVSLVVLTTSQTLDDFKQNVKAALRSGATPVEIKEALYQCAPYIGFPKVEKALHLTNDAFREEKISLPLQSQQTVSESTRFADGLKVQKSIFGNAIDKMHQTTPDNQKQLIQNYLSAFCFGDIYTRNGLDIRSRELLTFSIISALGGCESQVKAHIQGNLAVGNSKENLIDALAQSLPFIGFPRTLNALACVNAVIPEKE